MILFHALEWGVLVRDRPKAMGNISDVVYHTLSLGSRREGGISQKEARSNPRMGTFLPKIGQVLQGKRGNVVRESILAVREVNAQQEEGLQK